MSKVAKEVICDNCGEVLIILAKGSKIKPNIYALHEQCPTRKAEDNPVITPEVSDLMDMFGMKR